MCKSTDPKVDKGSSTKTMKTAYYLCSVVSVRTEVPPTSLHPSVPRRRETLAPLRPSPSLPDHRTSASLPVLS